MQTTEQPKHQTALTLHIFVLGNIDLHIAPSYHRLKITFTFMLRNTT